MFELLGIIGLVLIWIIIKGIKDIRDYNKTLEEILGGKDGMEDDIQDRGIK